MDKNLEKLIYDKANEWQHAPYDKKTIKEVKHLLDQPDKSGLFDAFYKNLEFGTGGLRGIMGVGSNRMNKYTVGAATQGFANYLKEQFPSIPQLSVVIGFDCRNNSPLFAKVAADVFSANGIKVYLFDKLRPTPEVSFAIRALNCQGGIMITASHNPKEYNGYKAYWSDGAQLVPPHDRAIIEEVNKIKVEDIRFEGNSHIIEHLGEEMDEAYLKAIKAISFNPEIIKKEHDLKIVYTPIHGTGVKLIPEALKAFGFTSIHNVPEQDVVSGDFPTVISPNPEEPAALAMALEKGRSIDADLIMASDPDADRLGIAIKNDDGEFVLVNGNQTALLLSYYIINQWKEKGLVKGNEMYIKTIVSSESMRTIAEKNGIECIDCYTGFKWIAMVIRENEGIHKYICGGEESYGFLPYDTVRDKDAVASCCVMAELAAWTKNQGKTLFELLQDIYIEYGFSYEKMVYIVKKGRDGAQEIQEMMDNFRSSPPEELAGSQLLEIKDFLSLEHKYLGVASQTVKLQMPEPSNVLQYFTADGTKVSIRPSGTEPKIKFYFEVSASISSRKEYHAATLAAEQKIKDIATQLGL